MASNLPDFLVSLVTGPARACFQRRNRFALFSPCTLAALAAVMMLGCSASWVVKDFQRQAGVVSYLNQGLDSAIESRQRDARRKMSEFCRGPFDVLSEIHESQYAGSVGGASGGYGWLTLYSVAIHNDYAYLYFRCGASDKSAGSRVRRLEVPQGVGWQCTSVCGAPGQADFDENQCLQVCFRGFDECEHFRADSAKERAVAIGGVGPVRVSNAAEKCTATTRAACFGFYDAVRASNDVVCGAPEIACLALRNMVLKRAGNAVNVTGCEPVR